MFIGHYAPAFLAAGNPRAQRLGALFVAAQLVDIAFFSFVLLGVEHMRITPGITAMNAIDLYDMPYTHSLIGALGFAAAWALGTRLLGGGWPAALIGAAVVVSHWLLDLLVHGPDLTLLGHGARHGLGLWNDPLIEMPLELGLVAASLIYYARRTEARRPRGDIALLLLGVALLAVQSFNWFAPQPTAPAASVPASQPLIAIATYVVLALLARWAAANRAVRGGPRIRSL